jgi:hypothetical protein
MEPNRWKAFDMAIIGRAPDLSIIIVNWNSLDYLRGCLESLRHGSEETIVEVIVVDNQSTDGSREALMGGEFPDVKLLVPERNLGFVRANNLGASVANGRHFLFLNPDTVVKGDALAIMTRALDENPGMGIVGCELRNGDMTLQTTCVQPFPTLTNQLLGADVLRKIFSSPSLWGNAVLYEPPEQRPKPVEVVCGACLMIRKNLFRDLGGFSRDYFMYAEEVDLCYAAAKVGWQVGYIGSASVVHYGGQSSRQVRKSSFADVLIASSVFTFFKKSKGTPYATLYRLGQAISGVCRLVVIGLGYLPIWCVRKRDTDLLRSAGVKWVGITRWAIGLEPWTQQLIRDVEQHQAT